MTLINRHYSVGETLSETFFFRLPSASRTEHWEMVVVVLVKRVIWRLHDFMKPYKFAIKLSILTAM